VPLRLGRSLAIPLSGNVYGYVYENVNVYGNENRNAYVNGNGYV
jgi:hypothetical protein